MINYCPECGIKLDEEDDACRACGCSLHHSEELIEVLQYIQSHTKPLDETISLDSYWRKVFTILSSEK